VKHHREQHFQSVFGRSESLKSGRPSLHLACKAGREPTASAASSREPGGLATDPPQPWLRRGRAGEDTPSTPLAMERRVSPEASRGVEGRFQGPTDCVRRAHATLRRHGDVMRPRELRLSAQNRQPRFVSLPCRPEGNFGEKVRAHRTEPQGEEASRLLERKRVEESLGRQSGLATDTAASVR
jgi:hypothetical protein